MVDYCAIADCHVVPPPISCRSRRFRAEAVAAVVAMFMLHILQPQRIHKECSQHTISSNPFLAKFFVLCCCYCWSSPQVGVKLMVVSQPLFINRVSCSVAYIKTGYCGSWKQSKDLYASLSLSLCLSLFHKTQQCFPATASLGKSPSGSPVAHQWLTSGSPKFQWLTSGSLKISVAHRKIFKYI